VLGFFLAILTPATVLPVFAFLATGAFLAAVAITAP
jgi:hypothetical protein